MNRRFHQKMLNTQLNNVFRHIFDWGDLQQTFVIVHFQTWLLEQAQISPDSSSHTGSTRNCVFQWDRASFLSFFFFLRGGGYEEPGIWIVLTERILWTNRKHLSQGRFQATWRRMRLLFLIMKPCVLKLLQLLFCLTQLNSGTEPWNEREHAASISFLKSDEMELGPTLSGLDPDKLDLRHPCFSHRSRGTRAVLMSSSWQVWVWRSAEKVQTHSQVSVCVLNFLFGRGVKVKLSNVALEQLAHRRPVQHLLPSVFFREHVSHQTDPFFFFFFFGLTNSSGRFGPRSFWRRC